MAQGFLHQTSFTCAFYLCFCCVDQFYKDHSGAGLKEFCLILAPCIGLGPSPSKCPDLMLVEGLFRSISSLEEEKRSQAHSTKQEEKYVVLHVSGNSSLPSYFIC